jgi:hypothetical protein
MSSSRRRRRRHEPTAAGGDDHERRPCSRGVPEAPDGTTGREPDLGSLQNGCGGAPRRAGRLGGGRGSRDRLGRCVPHRPRPRCDAPSRTRRRRIGIGPARRRSGVLETGHPDRLGRGRERRAGHRVLTRADRVGAQTHVPHGARCARASTAGAADDRRRIRNDRGRALTRCDRPRGAGRTRPPRRGGPCLRSVRS